MSLYRKGGLYDVGDPNTRASWSALVPAILVMGLVVTSYLPAPVLDLGIVKRIRKPFKQFLTLKDAEGYTADTDIISIPTANHTLADEAVDELDERDEEDSTNRRRPAEASARRTGFVFVIVGLLETLIWLSVASFRFFGYHHSHHDNGSNDNGDDETIPCSAIGPLLISLTWFYTVGRTTTRSVSTTPYDLVLVYTAHLGGVVLVLGGTVYDHYVHGDPLPHLQALFGLAVNFTVIVGLLWVAFAVPMATPTGRVKKEDIGVSISPEDYTTLWGWLSFNWVTPLLTRGRNTTLNESDIWELSPTMRSRPLFAKFKKIQESTLLRKIWVANSFDLVIDFILTTTSAVLSYTGPFFLKRILDVIDFSNPADWTTRAPAYTYALLAFVFVLIKAQCDVQRLWFSRRAATRVRSELMAAIYEKALKRKDFSGAVGSKGTGKQDKTTEEEAPQSADVGKIVNLMAGDANRVSMTVAAINFVYSGPVDIVVASVFLYQLLGWSAFVGLFTLLAGWPVNAYITKRSLEIQRSLFAARDMRMKIINELIGAIKFVKFFAWEGKWMDRALKAREVEMKWMIQSGINSVMFTLLWTCAPVFISTISFLVYVAQGNHLTIGTAFTSITLFEMIRRSLTQFPEYIIQIVQTGVTLERIQSFLDEGEVTSQVSSLKASQEHPKTPIDRLTTVSQGFGLKNATLKWNQMPQGADATNATRTSMPIGTEDLRTTERQFELQNISVIFPENQLTVITGPTASGKTALLLATLGELTLVPGGEIIMLKDPSTVDENGNTHTISYAAQKPWLRHQSIKDNILFGYPYDEERYQEVVECCALNPDFEMLEDGDATEIGARGVNLSGGQKSRVALARAVYAHTKYVLLDDPLSAVDSHTAHFLCERLLRGPLLKHRTVVLVTHHVDLVLPSAHYLVKMLDGRIEVQGTLEDLREKGLLGDIVQDESEDETTPTTDGIQTIESLVGEPSKQGIVAKKPRKLVEDETREEGKVKWPMHKTYLRVSSYWVWALLASLAIMAQFLEVSRALWIKVWGEAYRPNAFDKPPAHNQIPLNGYLSGGPILAERFNATANAQGWPSAIDHPFFYVAIFASIGLANAMTAVFSVAGQYAGAVRGSRSLFNRLLSTVVHATFRFHDTTPQGRILNRFGKDIETIDSSLPQSLQSINKSFPIFIAAMLTIIVVLPWFIVPGMVILYAFWDFAMTFLNTARDLRRMESNTRSPIYSDFGEVVEGIVTVRAFSAEKRYFDSLHQKIDTTTKMWYAYWMANRWLVLKFEWLEAISVLITMLFCISNTGIGAGLAGLCISCALVFVYAVMSTCRAWSGLELDLNSVERIVEYLDLPQEPPAIVESNRIPAYWPSSSNESLIVMENVVVKYAPDLPPVLHGVSLKLKAGERVGLLGRTGSGKSTLATSILRFVDPVSGRIVIDGVDISTIGLYDLRSRLTFIPQDAALFSGTLRDNLDPFGEHSDQECLDVLQRVGMNMVRVKARSEAFNGSETSEAIEDWPSNMEAEADSENVTSLETVVSANGANFSQGQRQLIAIARALLRRNSIVVMDEATSSVDFATDAKIQTLIRTEFHGSLLLTIAHRLRTVIDYDRLIILDKGHVVESGTPWNLIQQEGGVFRSMCLKSGSFDELESIANGSLAS